jgi:hypothetical protein
MIFALSSMPETISLRLAAVSFAILVPSSAFSAEFEISVLVSFADSALFAARLRTSSATTANPLPADPARAASTAALRASILVWKAISSIALITLLMF